jgi:hypothetical protein
LDDAGALDQAGGCGARLGERGDGLLFLAGQHAQ